MPSATLLHFTVSRTNQTPKILSTIPTHPISFSTPQNIRFPLPTTISPIKVSSQPLYDAVSAEQEEEEEDAIGDCLVYEEGIFDDPFLQSIPKSSQIENYSSRNRNSKPTIIPPSPENLIPEKWMDIQKELNITKKERRKITQGLEFGKKVESRRKALLPIDSEEYEKFKNEKLKKLNPVVLDNPVVKYVEEDGKDDEDERGGVEVRGRVAGRNPRLAVYGGGLEDISEVFSSGSYDPSASKDSKDTRKLFTKEEKTLLNRRIPDLAVATSGKWHPLHTLAASGEFYLVNSLLKHNIDINVPDKDGFTAVHKAILGKKQAIFNFLLRESATPFIRDEDGATLLHYAVFAASSQMIKILLLYNVDINLQDNDGWTALHLAVQSRRTDIVRLLLIKGADKTLKNQDGLTPLDLCLYSGRDIRTYELIKLFKQISREK